MTEIKQTIYELGNAWEEFKSCNDQILDDLVKTHKSDALNEYKLQRIHTELDKYKNKIDSLQTISTKETERKDFIHYLRTGELSREQKSFNSGTPPEGFSLIKSAVQKTIIKQLLDTSPMRQLCSTQAISTDFLSITKQIDQFESLWLSRNIAAVETNTPTIERIVIYTHLHYAQPKAEQRLLEDAEVDLEAWILERVIDTFSSAENEAFINGDGVTMPRGILAYSSNDIKQLKTGIDAVVTTDSLLNLIYELKSKYAEKATFLMHRITAQQIRSLKDLQDRYIWQPSLQLGQPDTLFGTPVRMADHMPVPAIDKLSVALADFKSAYQIIDRTGITVIRDAFTEKPFVQFFVTKRVGGAVTNFNAIKLLKLSV